MKLKIKRLSLIPITLFLFASNINAQDLIREKYFTGRWGIPEKPFTCAQNVMEMEPVLFRVLKNEPNPKGTLILIARLGKGETRQFSNKQRLFGIAERYKVLGVPTETIVVAEGERINDYGRVEIYWNGELLGALLANKNRSISLNCYEDDEKLFPVLRDVKRTKQKGRG